ncbi:MAG: SEL1-like repeat protein [Acidobacteria bacterium]|nr:SEL1-like repeat protein [Acidobacteriota bacterium]
MTKILLFASLLAPVYAAGEQELKDEAGKTIIRFVAETPESLAPAGTTDPAKQVGLFLCFPEHDRPTGDEILPVREALKRQGLLDNYVLIAGHPQGQKFGQADYEPIQKLLAWALKTYPINPRRVYMYGKGEGGKISGEMAMAYPNLVTAAISYSWTWWKMPPEVEKAIDPEQFSQFYMVLGRRDLSHHLTNVRDGYSRVQMKGVHVIYREFDDLGARTYHPPSNDEAIAWATRLRNRTLPLSKQEKALLDRPSIHGGYLRELALAGGLEAGAAVQKAFTSTDSAMRAAAARTCAEANLGEATMAALEKLAVDPSAIVRREAIRALAVNANWRSAAAQRALIELAVNPSRAVAYEDRVDAVDGLAYATRFQVKGVRQDPDMFRALVALLDGKQEELRTMAANILAPIRDGEFRGDIGRPEKKAPEGGWPAWLDGITAKNASYRRDYATCAAASSEAMKTFCKGESLLATRPDRAFALTLQAAEQGHVPAQAMVGMLYAIGKGTEQNVPEGTKWWIKAAEAGHGLAATNASMAFRGGGARADKETLARLTKQAEEFAKTQGQ